MKYQRVRKIISFISSFSLVLQSFLPVIFVAPAYAEDATPAAIVEVSPTPEVTPEITPEVTPEVTPTVQPTPEVTPEPTPSVEVTPEITPTPEVSVSPTPEVTPEVTPESTPSPESKPADIQNNSPPAVSDPASAPLPEPIFAISELEKNAPEITPSLTTDKSDYFPTDTVYVSGSGFQSSSSYILHIYSSDSPIFSIRPEVPSDENGTLAYSFKLDGNYRPHYTIDAYDTANKLVTTYSFTDTVRAWSCQTDAQGANDEPGQKDLTKMCLDTNSSNPLGVSWSWDEIRLTGNNTGDGCALFDNDNDGNANYAICVTWEKEQKIVGSASLYTCDDTRPDRCSATPVASYSSTCSVSNSVFDPFVAGDSYPNDTLATCDITLGDMVGTPKLVDVCSYPSRQPNSDPSDCVFTPTDNDTGTITVNKVLSPSSDPGLFNLQIDGLTVGSGANVGDTGTTGAITVSTGDRVISETAGTGTDITDYSSSINCTNSTGLSQGSTTNGSLTITVDKDEVITCTITNTRNAFCGDGVTQTPPEQCDDGASNATTCSAPYAGSCSFCEADTCQSKTITGAYCGDGNLDVGTSEQCDDKNNDNADGCSSTCQIEKGSITACKFEDEDRDGTKDAGEKYIYWTFGLDGNNFYPTTDGCITFSSLDLNKDYTVYENTSNGWASFNSTPKPVSLTNTHQSETVEFGNYQINICGDGYLDKGEVCDGNAPIACTTDTGYSGTQTCSTVTCTWDSCVPTEYCGDGKKNGSEVCDGADGTPEHYTCNRSCTLDYVPYCGDGTVNQATEQCDDGNTNDNDSCSSTCQTEYGQITIVKNSIPNAARNFTFRNDFGNDNPSSFQLDDDSDITLPNSRTFSVLPGTYKVTEDTVTGWKFSGATCTDGSTLDKITISPNESVTCTVTNKKLGTVVLTKNTTGSDGKFDFTMTGTGLPATTSLTTTSGTASQTFSDIDPENRYSITESSVAGWTLSSSLCINKNGTEFDPSDFTVNSGGTVTCTFGNTRDTGSIVVNKIIDADGDLQTTGDQTQGANWQFDVDGLDLDTTDALAQYTGSTGSATFADLKTGGYTVIETKQTGFDLVSANCGVENGSFDGTDSVDNVQVVKGEATTCTFYNTPNSTIHGYKWSDLDADGQKDENEGRLSGWTISLYKSNGDGFDSSPIATMDTSSAENRHGWYWFEKLTPGDYKVCETLKTGWNQTFPQNTDNDNCHVISLPTGSSGSLFEDSASGYLYNFGNLQLGKINVTKYNDLDGDGSQDDNESVLGGWTINLSDQESQVTGENGLVSFENLTPNKSYTLGEDLQGGWTQTNISCSVNNSSNGVKITSTGEAYGHHGNCGGWNSCGNAATCAQWACEVKGYDTLISYGDQRPCTEFGNCNLFWSRGSVQYNWGNWCPVMGVTDIVCGNSSEGGSYQGERLPLYAGEDAENTKNLNVNPGDVITCSIGNRQVNPKITISRSNNASTALNPGDSVEHTITISVLDNNVKNLKLTDLLSNGFKFRPGSYSVVKNGNTPVNLANAPEYHSPGVWELGDFNKDDVITIKYLADSISDILPGTYTDLAYATATDAYQLGLSIISTGENSEYVDGNYVGTDVEIVKSQSNEETYNVEKKVEGEVLGASTTLPATGASVFWLMLAFVSLVYGIRLLKSENKSK